MAGGCASRPFEAAFAEIYSIHEQELCSQRASYDKRLKEVHKEKEHYRGLLAKAQKQLASLDPSSSWKGAELLAEPHRSGAEAGGGIECSAGLDPFPDTSIGAAAGAQPGAASPAALVPGTGEAMLQGTAPATNDPKDARFLWAVIGGEDKGGILVREREQTDSRQCATRLATGSLIEETERHGDRLSFRRITGAGPKSGWISTRAFGKDLAVRVDRPQLRPRQPPPVAVGPNSEPPLPAALVFTELALPRDILGTHMKLPRVKEGTDMIKQIVSMNSLLRSTDRAQVMLPHLVFFVSGLAALEKLKDQRPEVVARAGAVAGQGAGQYLALCAAGVLSPKDGLNLTMLRIMALLEASALCQQRTVTVSGIEQDELHSLCLQACKAEGKGAVCQITAYLAQKYFWVGGTSKSVDLLEVLASKAGAGVNSCFPLAPHTSLMTTKMAELTAALEEVLPRMKSPLYTVWMNASAEPMRPGSDPADIIADLKKELLSPMLVSQCIDAMRKESIIEFYHVQLTTDRYEPVRPKSWLDWLEPWESQASRVARKA